MLSMPHLRARLTGLVQHGNELPPAEVPSELRLELLVMEPDLAEPDLTEPDLTGLVARFHSDAAPVVLAGLTAAGGRIERHGHECARVSFAAPVPQDVAFRHIARRLRKAVSSGTLALHGDRPWTVLLAPLSAEVVGHAAEDPAPAWWWRAL
jgi:hypothetical protein